MKSIVIAFLIISFSTTVCLGQVSSVDLLDKTHVNWHNKDLQIDSKVGVSVRKTYLELLKDKKSKKTVVVAVIDTGVDKDHEDLKDKVWINKGEIPDNNIDDDQNGYVDDVYGWNYLGGSSGDNINYENYEYTRLIKFKDVKHPFYNEAKLAYDKEFDKRKKDRNYIEKLEENLKIAKDIIKENTGVEVLSGKDLVSIKSNNEKVLSAKEYLNRRYSSGFTERGLARFKLSNDKYLKYYLNTQFNPREIAGDDPLDLSDKNYGNPNVTGPASSHGTSVAGVIAAIRDNGIGINGIATDVQIMVLRAIPNGDERDKDVALAIMYAVDNGADIINMSFGKKISPNKDFVDKAVRYAEDNNVLLVHAAGNEGVDIDAAPKFPSNIYTDGTNAMTWLNVGASDAKVGKEIAAIFSNYGIVNVDIFAPGVNIVSLDTGNTYSLHNGTSLSAPVVSGVAALLLSYYPDLTAKELKNILRESCSIITKPKKIYKPGFDSDKRKKTSIKKLSNTGGIINVYNAFIEAEKRRN
tara:strand:+ start:4947 stop:6518 length:1572 start_codon:yes stop_codon:yes gene_type:complete